ncbi:oxidoreductase [Erythrobacter sp. Dej080120_24]|uniref:Gfo/Idh/MocA family protein n=1 Tax=Erythrobacter sp. Dej080120_24 TaxID=3024837 RepID=UPI002921A5BC|nr:oxidoreductase [Erythrobacter sp. Dej080120_24]
MIDRALIVGLGSIGRRHLRLLRAELPGADIRVLRHVACDEAIERADGCFTDLGVACAFAPQLAIIASPAPFHLESARALAGAGAHLLVEKPLADRAEGVGDLIALCAARGLQLQVGYNLRFMDSLQAFRRSLAEGLIGQVHAVRCEIGQYLPSWRPEADYRETVSARRVLGGGTLLELSHELDMLRWVFGEVAWLSAWSGQQSTLEIDVEDSVMIQMGFAGGPVAQLGMDFLRRDTTRVCTAIGALGSLRWDAVAGRVALFDPGAEDWIDLQVALPQRDASYREQIVALLDAVKTGRPSAIAAHGADGLAVLRMVEAARASDNRDGRRILLERAA